MKGRALALAQRALLYAADELAMARMRLRVRLPGEAVRPHEAHFKLHEAEVPVKNKVRDLSHGVPDNPWTESWCRLQSLLLCPSQAYQNRPLPRMTETHLPDGPYLLLG